MNCSNTYGLDGNNLPIEIARGNIGGALPFGAYGEINTGGAVTNRLLWADGIWYIPNQTTGEQISVQSTSASDGVGGTGIRSVHVHYLDDTLTPQSEEIILNGLTPVLSIATNIRFIQCAHMDTYGSSKAAVGTITFTNIAQTQTYNQIDPLQARCSSSARMVPAGKRFILMGLVGSSVSTTADSYAIIRIAASVFEGHDYTNDAILIPYGNIGVQNNGIPFILPVPFVFEAGVIIGMTCTTNKAAIVTGDYFGWLEGA